LQYYLLTLTKDQTHEQQDDDEKEMPQSQQGEQQIIIYKKLIEYGIDEKTNSIEYITIQIDTNRQYLP
jgi:hypothetical protein